MKNKFIIFILLVFTFCCAIPASSQKFKVYSISGKVEKKSSNSWIDLKKFMTLDIKDVINIKPESSLRILDISSSAVYTFPTAGEYVLSNLISNAKQENNSLTRKIIAQSRKNIADNNTKSHKNIGAAMRGEIDEAEIETIYSDIVFCLKEKTNRGPIMFEKKTVDNELFYFSITNNSPNPVYANIFLGIGNSHWIPLYESDGLSGIKLQSNETVEMNHLIFIEDPDICYLGLGYTKEFPAEEIQFRLNENMEPLYECFIERSDVSIFIIE